MADGVQNYSVALVDAGGQKLTIITPLTQSDLESMAPVVVAAYVEDVYLAQGFGLDYVINLGDACGDAQAAIDAIQAIIDGISELGNSLQAKLDGIIADISAGNIADALDKLNALRNQTTANTGNQISNDDSAELLALLNELESALNEISEEGLSCFLNM